MGLWPFAKRGARIDTELQRQDLDVPLDFSAFAVNDACVKLWLPERLTKALDRLSAEHDASRPDVLRRLFFEHVYGREAFQDLVAWKRRHDEEARRAAQLEAEDLDMASPPRESARWHAIDRFGKASEDFKLWLPTQLQAELVKLAKADGMGLSDYLRKSLVRILLGERVFLDWQVAIGAVPDAWQAFETTEDI